MGRLPKQFVLSGSEESSSPYQVPTFLLKVLHSVQHDKVGIDIKSLVILSNSEESSSPYQVPVFLLKKMFHPVQHDKMGSKYKNSCHSE
ncbi:hypothetical protein [Mucilaginibacter pocheonensis]|uniref:Uncharacterized protein n=1 Tax=Mucilaginibacter pocheonensis TaxID=398050 RepID=A0ABU1TCI8_9SPHI|nr:hypothetical protein [Mucilaginibacter pocheonensis]MDR6943113.1 hypothetical protein [Mucilaginibacter pocheonensis]